MNKIICIGGALIDETFTCVENPIPGTSNPSTFFRSPGGVSFNVSHHLAQLGNEVELITHIGNDFDGKWLMEHCTNAGIGISHALINDQPTGRYVAVLTPKGELFTGAAAMHFETAITVGFLTDKSEVLKSAKLIQIDCNLSTECLEWIFEFCRKENIPYIVEPVSVAKAKKLSNINLKGVLLITPNNDELNSINTDNKLNPAEKIRSLIETRGVKNVWIRNGKDGSQLFTAGNTYSQSAGEIEIEDVTGAGDAALAGWIHYYLQGKNMNECLIAGQAMAELILRSKGSVNSSLNVKMFNERYAGLTD